MNCPICKRGFESTAADARPPFCGERCKLIDLGRWLRGSYQIPVAPVNDDADRPKPDRDDAD